MQLYRRPETACSFFATPGGLSPARGHLFCALVMIFLFLPAPAQSRTYRIVTSESSLWVYVEKAGLFSVFAHNHEIGVKSWSGSVTVPQAGASGAAAQFEVDARSLVVLDKNVSDKDRSEISNSMHKDVLESERHGKISFHSASISNLRPSGKDEYSFTLNGDLMLHGVTKRIAVPLTATITATEIRAKGKYRLKQTDYGIKPYSAAGGTVKVRNEVTVNFSIVARS
ncbi:MAG: YceI family protein [Acidobacteriota bacterium]|nr:MAG: YceI family protein [Acidobacteriota bacterium]